MDSLPQMVGTMHVIGTPPGQDLIWYDSPRSTQRDEDRYTHNFKGEDPATWISELEFDFEHRNVPEYEDYNRAMDFLEPKIIHRWCVSKNKYAHTWQGLKKLIGNRYGRSSEHSARDKLSRLTWKGSVEQLDRNLREALDGAQWATVVTSHFRLERVFAVPVEYAYRWDWTKGAALVIPWRLRRLEQSGEASERLDSLTQRVMFPF
ncbi:hypothetical protein Esti_000901 [Eimeria stiedai]